MRIAVALPLGLVLALPRLTGAAPPPTGFQDKVQISAPTRLDWKFAASAFGPTAAKVPADYDSRRQHYQLFVPRDYNPSKDWPLVVFISPGDDPLGWRYWQKTCEKAGALFCSPYAAGNSCPVGQRTRIVLDMLDDVRRGYKIDPDQTYLTGLSGGGRMACTIAFALPEYFGGVAPACGTNPLPRLDALAAPRPRPAVGGLPHRRKRLQPQGERGVHGPDVRRPGHPLEALGGAEDGAHRPPARRAERSLRLAGRGPEEPPRGRQGSPRPGAVARRGADAGESRGAAG